MTQITLDRAARQALEALTEIHPGNMTPMAEGNWNKAITALRAALVAQQQEPVGFINPGHAYELQQKRIPYAYVYLEEQVGASVPLYTHPTTQPASEPTFEQVHEQLEKQAGIHISQQPASEPVNSTELPGMWDTSDFLGGAPDIKRTASEPVAVPAGFALVPIEPTDEMIDAGNAADYSEWTDSEDAYRAMIAAAPKAANARTERPIMTNQKVIEQPLQGLAAYLRCEAGGVFVGSPNHETLMQWASEVEALTAGRAALAQQPAQGGRTEVLRRIIPGALNMGWISDDEAAALLQSTQEPLTDGRIIEIWTDVALAHSGKGWHEIGKAFTRAIEKSHGITKGDV